MSPPADNGGSDPASGGGAEGRRKRPRRRRSRRGPGEGSSAPEGTKPESTRREAANDKTAGRDSGGHDRKGRRPEAAGKAAGAGRDGRQRSRGRRRGAARKKGSEKGSQEKRAGSAAELLARKPETVDLQKDVEEPLRPSEVAVLRGHFRFLRAHRKELRLKVNAAEDLLLNGSREPTHRGVCQHLLGKVDRSSVLAAAERLEPAAAAKLLAGVIQFSADIEYVLLFLEKIKQSTSSQQATAALAQGLERIDFDRVSSAQMRRVLSLIAELFPARDRPELMLGLLESRGFRTAFDSSLEGLPEPLVRLLVPLRAVQAVVLHGRPNTYDPEILAAGIGLLLSGDDTSLQRRSPEARQRLFSNGLDACSAPDHPHHQRLGFLLASLAKNEQQHKESGLALTRHLLAAQRDDEARKVLTGLSSAHPDFKLPARWLGRLQQARRFGRFAVDERKAERRDALGQQSRLPGHSLDTMRPVWIQIASSQHEASHAAVAALLDELTLPGVAPLLGSGVTTQDEAYFATPSPGQPLEHVLRHKGGLSLHDAASLCLEGSTLLASLAALGIRLPDAALQRFERSADGSLWIVDLAGATRGAEAAAVAGSSETACGFCQTVLASGRRYLPPADLLAATRDAQTAALLARWLARSSLLGGSS